MLEKEVFLGQGDKTPCFLAAREDRILKRTQKCYLDKISPEEGSQPEPDPDPAENPWPGREVSVSDHRVDRQQLLQHPPPSQTVADPENVREQPQFPFIYLLLFIIYLFKFLLFIKNHFMLFFSTCLPSRMEVRNTAENIVLFLAHLNLG